MKRFLAIAIPAAALAATGCLIVPAPAEAQAMRYIYLYNNCRRPIQAFVHHADGYRNWHPHGWYQYQPYEGTFVSANDVQLRQLEDHDLYFYAETTDGGTIDRWQGESGDLVVRFDGGDFTMRKAEYTIDTEGNFSVSISCGK